MSATLDFLGIDNLPAVTKTENQVRLLRAAASLDEPISTLQGLALVVLLCRGSSADIEATLIRLFVFLRAYGRRDVLSFLAPDPISKALSLESQIKIEEVTTLFNTLTGIELPEAELEAEAILLTRLRGSEPFAELIEAFKGELGTRVRKLFTIHRRRVGEAAARSARGHFTVDNAEYDKSRYKPRHWQSVVDVFANHGVYPPAYLKETARLYGTVPWPESCKKLLEGHNPTKVREARRCGSKSQILEQLLHGELRPADIVRLALQASAFNAGYLYIPRHLWFELAWSLLDGSQRTPDLEDDLNGFQSRMDTVIPKPESIL